MEERRSPKPRKDNGLTPKKRPPALKPAEAEVVKKKRVVRLVEDDEDVEDIEVVRKKGPGGRSILVILGAASLVLLLVCGGGGGLMYLVFREPINGWLARLRPPKTPAAAVEALRSGDLVRRDQAIQYLQTANPEPPPGGEVGEALEPLLKDPDQQLQEIAALCLARWAVSENVPLLNRMLEYRSEKIKEACLDALIRIKDARAADALAKRMGNFFERDKVFHALQQMGPVAEPSVINYYFAGDMGLRDAARRLAQGYGTKKATLITQALADMKGTDPARRKNAVEWVSQALPEEAFRAEVAKALEPLVDDGTLWPADPVKALAAWATRDNVPTLVRALKIDRGNKGDVMNALARLKDERAIPALAERLADFFTGKQAADALQAFGPAAEKEVARYFHHQDNGVQQRARDLIKSYGTKDSVILAQTKLDLKATEGGRRKCAVEWLAQQTTVDEEVRPEMAAALVQILQNKDQDPFFRRELVLKALKLWATREQVPAILALLADTSSGFQADEMRASAMEILAATKDPRAPAALALFLATNQFHRPPRRWWRWAPWRKRSSPRCWVM